jgi:hypothetical protein
MCRTLTNHSLSILLIRLTDDVVCRVQAAPSAEGAGPHTEAGDCGGAPRRHTHLLLPVPPLLPHLQLAAHPRLLDPLPGGRARRRAHCTLLPARQEARHTPVAALIKKENELFLKYKKSQMGSVAKSNMRNAC